MIEDLYTEKLNWFKQNERPEVVLLLAENPDLVKIVIAGTSLKIRRADELTGLSAESESEIWEWLWKNTMFSLTELKEKADIHLAEHVLEKKMKPLIGNRILYPDGTVNSYVQRYLKERVIKLFESKLKRPIKKN